MQLRQTATQTDFERLSDMVSAAMETGNAGRARTILGEHEDTFPDEVTRIKSDVLRGYGVRL